MARRWFLLLNSLQSLLKRWGHYLLLVGLVAGACIWAIPGSAGIQPAETTHNTPMAASPVASESPSSQQPTLDPAPQTLAQAGDPLTQGRELYAAGRYAEAAQVLAAAVQGAANPRQEAIALRNLSLVYQYLGQWDNAETAITRSLELLQDEANTEPQILAQALDVRGRLQFYRGDAAAALDTWEDSAALYDEVGDDANATQARLNQAEALQSMGFYRRAIELLSEMQEDATEQPDSAEQVERLRRLGNALRVAGDLERSRQTLMASLEMAERLQRTEALARIYDSLGSTAYAGGDFEAALTQYDIALRQPADDSLQVQIGLNRLRTLIALERPAVALEQAPPLQQQIDALPLSRLSIDARINLGDSLLQLAQLNQAGAVNQAAPLLATAVQQARELGDRRTESYALGTLAKAYEQAGQWEDAKPLTDEALQLVQSTDVPELRYLWEWQLGRILKEQNDRAGAIAAYTSAIETLEAVRRDLAAINPEAQFSFRESVEPIHRELVSLLLSPDVEPTDEELEQARFTIESLQLAELDNFFREACLNARSVQIDAIDQEAAVIYPIILSDRLEVILSIPEEPLQRYSAAATADTVTEVSNELLRTVRNIRTPIPTVQQPAKQLYDWLVAPARASLDASGLKTLVFVPDGVLRNLPLATLYDGQEYLIQNYGVAIAPTLQLLEAGKLDADSLSALMGGLSEGVQGFFPLPWVEEELTQLQDIVSAQVILNDNFTTEEISERIREASFPIVHLATHGEFSSTVEDTFILTFNDRLDINELRELLQTAALDRPRPIELLVLSACRTATGDDRAALGLAGVAVRSGARSTIASLWYVRDQATSRLMIALYANLASAGTTKAEALRQAQIAMVNGDLEFVVRGADRSPIRTIDLRDNPDQANLNLSHPYFWSAFVLVGNWQ
ncbi:CHAT domain-containing protein [Vacuolonema iberomarrocanum]|uniref:CHAT domain-containing protein n=1 Tax=Vacuolonema iberomarrocanum TaxID=3454632 RepID=UPI001A04D4AD|nr:CHAT domain-containing protein [filamentous cyanobacterium LEGE 07170]